jgi:hypothetical protein
MLTFDGTFFNQSLFKTVPIYGLITEISCTLCRVEYAVFTEEKKKRVVFGIYLRLSGLYLFHSHIIRRFNGEPQTGSRYIFEQVRVKLCRISSKPSTEFAVKPAKNEQSMFFRVANCVPEPVPHTEANCEPCVTMFCYVVPAVTVKAIHLQLLIL